MGLKYRNLEAETRRLMLEEIDLDIAGRGLYLSNYLTDAGKEDWPGMLREAADNGSDESLKQALDLNGSFKLQVERRKQKGGFSVVAVPYSASQTLSESQFNMYYIRAMARRSIVEERPLIVYRAKTVENPRTESEQMIGTQLYAQNVLDVLRTTLGVEPTIGIPQPNSGISVTLG